MLFKKQASRTGLIENSTGDPEMDARLAAYQRKLEAELPGDPTRVFIGIGFALFAFMVMAVAPWVLDYMQEAQIIRPRIHLGKFGPFDGAVLLQGESPSPSSDAPADAPAEPAGPFGRPRHE
jgi:hypothetical protein